VGKKYKGTVIKTGTLGALVEFEPGIYGFIKYSDVEDKKKIEKPLEIGEEKMFEIKNISPEERRMILTL
jgi:ribosomal protein S1